jgi:hypothetical protein
MLVNQLRKPGKSCGILVAWRFHALVACDRSPHQPLSPMQFTPSANNANLRFYKEGGGNFGKMKINPKDKTSIQHRQDLQAIWNNRSDLQGCRYYHATPKEFSTTKIAGTHNNTRDNVFPVFKAQAHFDARKTGKRRQVGHPISCNPGEQFEQQNNRKINCSNKMNASTNVQQLLQHQIDAPSSINAYPNSTGKRHSGLSRNVIQQKSNQRATVLMAAEAKRIERVGRAKGNTYKSDGSAYFGYESQVLLPKTKTHTFGPSPTRQKNDQNRCTVASLY